MSLNNAMNSSTHAPRPLSVLICALGGEGGGVLSDWLMEIARKGGYAAQATSIPGVAQRTGATTYFFELYPVPVAQLAGRKPVFSLNPIPGSLDGVIASELLEAARCASNGLPSSDRTVFITSTSRTFTTAERTAMGDGRLDSAALLALVQSVSRVHHAFDMQRVATEMQNKVGEAIRNSPAKDLEKNVRTMMTQGFQKLDLVTRDEFDLQAKVLAKTREKLTALEAKVAEIEKLRS
jgi:BMFP domain-containing protein YqiC